MAGKRSRRRRHPSGLACAFVVATTLLNTNGCGKKAVAPIKIDGSSTVFPITKAAAEAFRKENGNAVEVTVGITGTGGGFKKFCAADTDICDASRPINPSEVELCAKNNVEYIELPIAFDGLAVVVNPKNSWVSSITVAELKKIWAPAAQGKIMKWNQVRPEWPDKELHLFGAGVDSGTYDYFTDAINGKEHASRSDYSASEDDNALVQGVARDESALGFFGLAYFEANTDKLKLVAVDDGKPENGDGPVLPTADTVKKGTYQPLSRPLFLYVSKKSIVERTEVNDVVWFYLAHGPQLVADVKYIPLPLRAYGLAKKRADARKTGSIFGGKGSQVGVSIEGMLEKE